LKTIKAGIMNETIKTRMDESKNPLHILEAKIMIEEYNEKNKLTKDDILKYLTTALRQKPHKIIHTLIQKKIVLYDDKVIIYYNYSDKNKNPNDDNSDFYLFPLSSDRNSMSI